MNTSLIWITPNAEQMISDMARVSNPDNQGKDGGKLLSYLVRNKHWSPFEMASACFEINTTRDIARQILRHRSFAFQEFSQRYAKVEFDSFEYKEARLQDDKNRQNSIAVDDPELAKWFEDAQERVFDRSQIYYNLALDKGIAKEVARALLPEGLTTSRMYMSGTIRSWIHYLQVRRGNGTQKEHMDVADSVYGQLAKEIPNILEIV